MVHTLRREGSGLISGKRRGEEGALRHLLALLRELAEMGYSELGLAVDATLLGLAAAHRYLKAFLTCRSNTGRVLQGNYSKLTDPSSEPDSRLPPLLGRNDARAPTLRRCGVSD